MANVVQKTLDLLREWVKAEEDTIAMTNEISKSTQNDAIKIFMTVIRADSGKHKQIQEFLIDALTQKPIAISFDEIANISGMINDHLRLEQKTVELGEELVKDLNLPVHKELITYLLDDERKHVTLLNALASMKERAQKNT